MITGIHSVIVEGDVVSVIYDIRPQTAGNGLYFDFELPERITREELSRLANGSPGGLRHLALSVARAASGHAAAAPPRSVMNSRRFTQSTRRRGRSTAAAR